MKCTWIAIWIVAAAPAAAQSPAALDAAGGERAGIPWEKSFEAARAAAAVNEKPLLVDFGAEWCGFCKKLDRETFTDDRVIRLVRESFVAVKVDVDKSPELGKKYEIQGLPTLVFLAPTGEALARLEGYRPADQFLKEARQPAESSSSLKKLRELAEKDRGDIDAQRAYARAVFAAGNAEGALKVLEAARATLPREGAEANAKLAGILLDTADALRTLKKPAEARAAYEQLLAMDAAAGGDTRRKAFLPLAGLLLGQRELDACLKVLDTYLASAPAAATPDEGPRERLEALFLRGYVYAVKKDPDKAVRDLKAAQEADPDGRWGQRAEMILEAVNVR
ncbi:MAG TPA: thioredoxin fold domain-containing protein [Planctomycetota bacterium]|nr:thioredoxin fold domain-containing protein [Planctomycetota bacterium]